MSSEGVCVAENSLGSRKRQKNKQAERIIKKNMKYAPKDLILQKWRIPCNHNVNKTFECNNIDACTLIEAKKNFFKDNSRIKQNIRLGHLIHVCNPKRHRERNNVKSHKPHDVQIQYTVRKGKLVYKVCQIFFQKLFEVSTRRILSVAKHIKSAEEIKENRGGDRWTGKMSDKLDSVKLFIGKFKGRESHYNRAKSRRLYLPSTLTISKMWKMYNKEVDDNLKVKYSYFHKIFSRDFNLGFGSPATDVCSYCTRMKYQLQVSDNADVKQALSAELKVHKVKAKQFNLIMNEKIKGAVTLCFDLQQVQNLPKLPNQEAFYSYQIAFYSFCIVNLNTQKSVFYTWTEELSGRGSNQIGSALLDFLRKYDFTNIFKIRLFSDGCGGQNKNSHIMHLLMWWLQNESPDNLSLIEITFPVRGHSYLPADRVFGRVERELRRQEEIVFPIDYENIYRQFGEVRVLKKDWIVYDLKCLMLILKKYEGISEQKRIYIKKKIVEKNKTKIVQIKSEVFYRNNDPSKSYVTLLKRGKALNRSTLSEVTDLQGISEVKGKSVNNLLKTAFGENWISDKNFEWYFNVLTDFIKDVPIELVENHDECDCLEEETELKT